MEEKISKIRKWLGTGSIDIFGLPMSGKDTVGVRLAETLGARFLSSGMIIRTMEKENKEHYTDEGHLLPTDLFYEWILPYFKREDLKGSPLVLSSVGRWSGEEERVMEAAEAAGHPIKAVVLLNVSEEEVLERWREAKELGKRDLAHTMERRLDDADEETFQTRISEFNTKTVPVIRRYQDLGMLVTVSGGADRETVFRDVVDELYEFSLSQGEN
ncbi:nucleoside monophosphate kinase [Candidatus Saccharibacteria bacterium]|nr:nucleoside monophosphate kinase [Candidatus Saccharibacteria bacterium]